jgi:O-methyltransferase
MSFSRALDLVPTIDQLPGRRRETFPEISDESFWQLYERCKDYSLVHVTGFYNVYRSMHYLAANKIIGAAVECGCFLGGIAMFIGLLRKRLDLRMEIILFDTFKGPPIGSTSDMILEQKLETPDSLPYFRDATTSHIYEALGSMNGYKLVEGLVEETLPVTETGRISLLRLDTDFYQSTSQELHWLYPRLVSGGILIIDDYGLVVGSRQATDEYLGSLSNPPLLNRIDMGVWAGIKP